MHRSYEFKKELTLASLHEVEGAQRGSRDREAKRSDRAIQPRVSPFILIACDRQRHRNQRRARVPMQLVCLHPSDRAHI